MTLPAELIYIYISMKKETVLWQIIVVILGLFLILTLNYYLQENNKIKALSENAKCIADMQNAFTDENRFEVCEDILNFKNKSL